ncbi:hypothetical protein PHMEG_00033843 [Phytophthora megakarya]|uniref:Uncharacterized protein n=1 Tax=Phytophthora megakarya TaxID=4795 RepID=A0A225USD3_9STRA|nr:hypothetical protein PHMEG_00033843 [Phytophthora megakarya]
MVRVPGTSDCSGFHLEPQEEVQVKTEQGIKMSPDTKSTTTSLNARSADRQSARRNSGTFGIVGSRNITVQMLWIRSVTNDECTIWDGACSQ